MNGSMSFKRLLIFISVAFVCSLVFFVPARGEEAVASVEDREMLMGSTMRLTIDVPMPDDTATVTFPILQKAVKDKSSYIPLLNDSVELLTRHTVSKEKVGNRNSLRFNLYIQSFDSGYYRLPSFEFEVSGKPVRSNSVDFSVLPVKASANDTIDGFYDYVSPFEKIDTKSKDSDEEESLLVWWLVGAAIILAALIVYLYIRFKKTGTILPRPKPVAPNVEAVKRLRKLEQQHLPSRGRTKEYYTKLCDILRSYLHNQFDIRTFERTTSEILNDVSGIPAAATHEGILRHILEVGDFVKFAKVNPSDSDNTKCMNEAIDYVEASFREYKNEMRKEAKDDA